MPGHCSATCRVRSVLRSTTTMMRTAGPSGWRSLKAAFAVTSASRQRGSRDSSLRAGTTTPTLRIPMVSAGPCWSAKPGMFDVSAPTAGRAHFGLRHCFGERRHVTSPSRRATDRAGEGVSTSSRKSPSTCSASTARPDSWRMRRCTSSPTEFLRSDELPGDAAIGYLAVDRPRTNVFHLPVLGSRDGGIYTTVADVHALWGGAGRRSHRADGPGGADAATTQRGSDRIKAVRTRVLAGCHGPGGDAGRNGRRGVVPLPARRRCRTHLDSGVQHDRRCLADRAASRRAAAMVTAMLPRSARTPRERPEFRQSSGLRGLRGPEE